MTEETYASPRLCGAVRGEGDKSPGAADWLGLAAAPTFAVMALATYITQDTPLHILCSAAHGTGAMNGMCLMYLLMSAFHLPPWLRLLRG
jgi:hypothetical protein